MIARFRTLCAAAGFPSAADSLYQDLAAAYGRSDRHYHNLHHVADCLELFDDVRHLARHPVAVELAVYYHDLVYDTHAADNEEQSAQSTGAALLAARAEPELVSLVQDLIRATKHLEPPRSADQALLMDIDLAVLGAAPDAFDRYEKQVREEYAWVPEPIFWDRRAAILKAFLARPHLFYTEGLRARLEGAARENLARSIARAAELGATAHE